LLCDRIAAGGGSKSEIKQTSVPDGTRSAISVEDAQVTLPIIVRPIRSGAARIERERIGIKDGYCISGVQRKVKKAIIRREHRRRRHSRVDAKLLTPARDCDRLNAGKVGTELFEIDLRSVKRMIERLYWDRQLFTPRPHLRRR